MCVASEFLSYPTLMIQSTNSFRCFVLVQRQKMTNAEIGVYLGLYLKTPMLDLACSCIKPGNKCPRFIWWWSCRIKNCKQLFKHRRSQLLEEIFKDL